MIEELWREVVGKIWMKSCDTKFLVEILTKLILGFVAEIVNYASHMKR